MNYNVKTLPSFDRSLKKLAKKYPSLKTEFIALVNSLKENPKQGVALGLQCFKIRISISSKGKGKSGGARVITNFVIDEDIVFLLSIYDKSNKDSLSDKELRDLLKDLQI